MAVLVSGCDQNPAGLSNTQTDAGNGLFANWKGSSTNSGLGLNLSNDAFGSSVVSATKTAAYAYSSCLAVAPCTNGPAAYNDGCQNDLTCTQWQSGNGFNFPNVILTCSQSITIGGNQTNGQMVVGPPNVASSEGCPSGTDPFWGDLTTACESSNASLCGGVMLSPGAYTYGVNNALLQVCSDTDINKAHCLYFE